MLFDASALCPPALFKLGLPRGVCLLCNDGMIPTVVIAKDEAVHGTGSFFPKSFQIAAQTTQAGENLIVVRQAGRRDLMPRRGPEHDCIPCGFGINRCRKIAVTQARDMERHEREVLQVAVGMGERGIHRPIASTKAAYFGYRAAYSPAWRSPPWTVA